MEVSSTKTRAPTAVIVHWKKHIQDVEKPAIAAGWGKYETTQLDATHRWSAVAKSITNSLRERNSPAWIAILWHRFSSRGPCLLWLRVRMVWWPNPLCPYEKGTVKQIVVTSGNVRRSGKGKQQLNKNSPQSRGSAKSLLSSKMKQNTNQGNNARISNKSRLQWLIYLVPDMIEILVLFQYERNNWIMYS